MERVDKKQNFDSKVYNIEKINPFFSKVKIYVMYDGFNRKGSYLSRNAINEAIPTIYNLPIVGDYLVDERNFGSHGASVVKNAKGERELVLSTRPYGTIPESAQIYWELVTENDGKEREYLVIDGAYLWTGRYPELHTILDEGHYGQSMEIEIVNANQSFIDGQEVLNIQDFIFTGFCLLGIDKDSDMFGHVEPAFESGKVVTYSLDKETFTSQFNQMIDELKFTLTEGGNSKMENDKKVSDAQEDLKKRLDNVVTTDPVEDGKAPVAEPVANPEPPVTEDPQVVVEDPQTDVTPEPDPITPDPITPATEGADGVTEGAVDGTTDGGEGATAFSITEEEYVTLKTNFEAMEAQVAELSTYKRNRELGDLQGKFSNQISEQELKEVFEANPDASIEKLEVEIFALIGMKNYSLDSDSKTKQNKVSVVSPKVENNSKNPYGDIQFIN